MALVRLIYAGGIPYWAEHSQKPWPSDIGVHSCVYPEKLIGYSGSGRLIRLRSQDTLGLIRHYSTYADTSTVPRCSMTSNPKTWPLLDRAISNSSATYLNTTRANPLLA
ncbi:hypothetical protein U1Q18_015607 [Sarracenia purpurea var. burkii]